MKNIIFGLFLLAALTGCKKYDSDEDVYAVEAMEMDMDAPAGDKMYAEMAPPPPPPVSNAAASQTPADYEQKIIKNAELRFETDDLSATATSIQNAVQKYKAQIQQDSESKNNYELSRYIVVRIPSKNFENFIADISRGISYFERKEITTQDVTAEYIDLSARIKAKKVLEQRYLELLKKAGKVSEMLEIEKELSAIREEIEAQEGRLRYMQNQVTMSTVNIQFYKKTEVQAGATVSYTSKMGNAIKSGFNALSTFFIGILYLWPFILIFVIVFFVVRRRLRKRKKYNTD